MHMNKDLASRYGRSARRALVWLCGCVLLVGCAGSRSSTPHHDPLFGPPPPRPRYGASAADTGGTPEKEVTALPAPPPSGSPAALASGKVPVFDAGRDLRIAGGDSWKGSTTGVTLSPPEPAATAPAQPQPPPQQAQQITAPQRPGGAPATITLVRGPQVSTFEEAQAQLQARGITRHSLAAVGGEWRFIVWVPNRDNPDINRRYEYQATEPVAAIRAVLEQIDRDR